MSTEARKKTNRLVDNGPGKTILMPDIYAAEFADNEADFEFVDQLLPAKDESEGFDPYNTAVLQKK